MIGFQTCFLRKMFHSGFALDILQHLELINSCLQRERMGERERERKRSPVSDSNKIPSFCVDRVDICTLPDSGYCTL